MTLLNSDLLQVQVVSSGMFESLTPLSGVDGVFPASVSLLAITVGTWERYDRFGSILSDIALSQTPITNHGSGCVPL